MLAGVVIVACMCAAILTPPGQIFLDAVRGSLDPSSVSWDGKSAFARCSSAIAGRSAWPVEKRAMCEAMSMCVEEAPLSTEQTARLGALMRERGCLP